MLKREVTVLWEAHFCKMTKLAMGALTPSGQMLRVKCNLINYMTNFNFVNLLLLCNGNQHVSTTHTANVSMICLRTRIELYLKCV